MEVFHQRLYASPATIHRVLDLRHHGGVGRRWDMRFTRVQRITTAVNRFHRNPIQFSLTTTSHSDLEFNLNFNSAMDESNAKKEIKSGDGSSVVKEDTKESKKSSEILPPPEKPLPGDCCGSGCVRCVWDVYYEELEEYNKLRQGESDSSTGSKAS